jgi:hypothetical protein
MNRSHIDDALTSGKPFTIRTADGKEFLVRTRDHIYISPKGTFVQVVDDKERINSIPLLTMTSVEYQARTS